MKVWCYKNIGLYLIVLLSFVYPRALLHAKINIHVLRDYANVHYNTYYGLHFDNYYKPVDNTEGNLDSVMIRFASHDSYRYMSFMQYVKGQYQDVENLNVSGLDIPFNREDRTFDDHDVMFMQLSSYWGKVTFHSLPIGGCKVLYAGSIIYDPVSAIAFLENENASSKVCICFVGKCNVKPERNSCDKKSIRCKKVTVAINPPPFCSILDASSIVSITPLRFSQQTFFRPGVRIHIYSGSGNPYTKELYVKSHKIGDKTSYNISHAGIPYEFQVYKAGYDTVCAEYSNNGEKGKKVCVPSPGLMRPKVTSNANGVNIQYQDCQGLSSCSVDMLPGTQDLDMYFSVIKPKIDFNNYTLLSRYECEDGKIVENENQCVNGIGQRLGYVHDNNSNVTCVVDMPFVPMKYSIKKNHRDLWLSMHDKMLLGYGVVVGKTDTGKDVERYVQCDQKFAIDIKSMTQEQLNKITRIRQDAFFDIGGHYNPKNAPCQDSMLYRYENNRLYEKGGQVSCKNMVELDYGTKKIKGCSSLYISDDDFTYFFHENDELEKIVPLNPILQGMCVSNFPSYEYKKRVLVRKILPDSYKLGIDQKNTECDFLKIEAWGGGASGISRSGRSGKAGNYVMGLLRFDKNVVNKKLIIDIGDGGKGANSLSNSGGDTTVKLCDDDDKNCLVKIIAHGGDEGGNYLQDSSEGIDNLVHYRFAPGLQNSGEDEILVPYQNPDMPYGKLHKGDKECSCNSDLLEKNSNKYWGAGGCSSIYNCAQEGADGMVRITCEKWSGNVGKISLIDENACSDLFVTLIEKMHKSTSGIPDVVKEFLQKISKVSFCRQSKSFPNLISSMSKYFTAIDEILASGDILGHNLSGLRKELFTELSNTEVKAMLAKLGINESPETLLLYLDVLNFNFGVNISNPPSGLLNYYISDNEFDYDLLKRDVDYDKLSDNEAMMFNVTTEKPEQWLSVELKDQEFARRYGNFINMIHRSVVTDEEGHKKNNIVVSWMYTFFKSDKQLFELYAAPFVKLMLGMDLDKFMKWGSCSDTHIKLFESIDKYSEKLPSRMQDFIKKIATGDFCNTFSKMELLNSYGVELSNYAVGCALKNANKSCLESKWRSSLGSMAKKLQDAVDLNYEVFTNIGIASNRKEIALLIDAVMLNYVMSDLNVGNSDITSTLSLLDPISSQALDNFPYDTIVELRQDASNMKYGKYGDHRANIVTLWSYMAYNSFEWNVEDFKSFVKLLLAEDLTSVKIRKCSGSLRYLFDKLSQYKNKLPAVLQDFLDKISKESVCRRMSRFPALETLLVEYIEELLSKLHAGNLFSFSSLYDLNYAHRGKLPYSHVERMYYHAINVWSDVGKLSSNITNLLNDPEVYKIFTDAGITSSQEEISLAFDAVIFNLLLSEMEIDQQKMRNLLLLIYDNNLTLSDIRLERSKGSGQVQQVMVDQNRFPGNSILMLQQNANNIKYGNYGVHRADIIALWSYISYISSESGWSIKKYESFIKLLLGIDLKFADLKGCDNDIIDLFNRLNAYGDKLPLSLRDFLTKISERNFCKEMSLFPELELALMSYVNGLSDILRVGDVFKVNSVANIVNGRVSNINDVYSYLGNLLSDVRELSSNIADLLNNPDVYKIFTDVGITSSKEDILLSIDAIIFNLLVSEIKIDNSQLEELLLLVGGHRNASSNNANNGRSLSQGIRYKITFKISFAQNYFPVDEIIKLQQDANNMEYGVHGVHRTDIIALWSYISYASSKSKWLFKRYQSFAGLLFEIGAWGKCTSAERVFFTSMNRYSEKLPLKVYNFIRKITTGDFARKFSGMQSLYTYKQRVYDYVMHCVLRGGLGGECSDMTLREISNELHKLKQEIYSNYDVFRDLGITNGQQEVLLLINVMMLNYAMSDLLVSTTQVNSMLADVRSSLSRTAHCLPYGTVSQLQRSVSHMKYGEYSNYRASVVALWACISCLASFNDDMEPLIKLMLEGD
ncbi:entry-triggering protein EtpE [Ehrlichia chaffeensis]|uniref:entry-triggering protein EtpE n=1 Tax=Ehrlichia chaffeensis TaxID=945 RepID=UPI000444EB60|nr:hypothetical protein [Ehrlichia chaffeensis]AHX08708.1 hypothetical protein ECHSTV_0131 [Ehrlichia chaffeensis str. Saint Vincent]